jgi:hypothetical protein
MTRQPLYDPESSPSMQIERLVVHRDTAREHLSTLIFNPYAYDSRGQRAENQPFIYVDTKDPQEVMGRVRAVSEILWGKTSDEAPQNIDRVAERLYTLNRQLEKEAYQMTDGKPRPFTIARGGLVRLFQPRR